MLSCFFFFAVTCLFLAVRSILLRLQVGRCRIACAAAMMLSRYRRAWMDTAHGWLRLAPKAPKPSHSHAGYETGIASAPSCSTLRNKLNHPRAPRLIGSTIARATFCIPQLPLGLCAHTLAFLMSSCVLTTPWCTHGLCGN